MQSHPSDALCNHEARSARKAILARAYGLVARSSSALKAAVGGRGVAPRAALQTGHCHEGVRRQKLAQIALYSRALEE
jgi:hypothetical protein